MPEHPPQDVSALTAAARRDLYGDAFNEAVFMRGGQGLTRAWWPSTTPPSTGGQRLAHLVVRVSDGMLRGADRVRRSYALSMLAGSAGLFAGRSDLAACPE